jgi:hypothetical protein
MSIRVGLAAGMASVIMALLVLGLRRMAQRDEEDRFARRTEALGREF